MAVRKITVVACFLVGISIFVIALYLLAKEIYFVQKASAFEAPIVEVRNELVAKGKGSVLAYVPLVAIPGRDLRTRVDTFNEEPVYKVGDKIAILCDPAFVKCKKNTLADKWGDIAIDFILSLAFLSIPLLYYRHSLWRQTIRNAKE